MVGQDAYVDGPRQSFSGGAGLLSTATDYATFLQTMLNGGQLGGTRVLSRKRSCRSRFALRLSHAVRIENQTHLGNQVVVETEELSHRECAA